MGQTRSLEVLMHCVFLQFFHRISLNKFQKFLLFISSCVKEIHFSLWWIFFVLPRTERFSSSFFLSNFMDYFRRMKIFRRLFVTSSKSQTCLGPNFSTVSSKIFFLIKIIFPVETTEAYPSFLPSKKLRNLTLTCSSLLLYNYAA